MYVTVDVWMNPAPLMNKVSFTDPAAICVGVSDVIDGDGLGVGPLPMELLPPPPQLGSTINRAINNKVPGMRARRPRSGTPNRHTPNKNSDPRIAQSAARRPFVVRAWDCPRAVVVTVSVVAALPLALGVTCAGLKLQVVSAGRPEQEKLVTVPLKPYKLFAVMETLCDWPAVR